MSDTTLFYSNINFRPNVSRQQQFAAKAMAVLEAAGINELDEIKISPSPQNPGNLVLSYRGIAYDKAYSTVLRTAQDMGLSCEAHENKFDFLIG